MSDGQFSAKPMRSANSRHLAITASASAGDAALSGDAVRDFLQSRVVRREVNALLEQPFPYADDMNSAPLHRSAPTAAQSLGRPITSATLVQEYLIGLIFLRFWGWIFLGFGVLFFLIGMANLIGFVIGQNDPQMGGIAIVIVAVGFLIGGAGAWFGIFRGRVITEMCWFCPRGMIWMTDGQFDWYMWEEVPELYCKAQAVRPAIGIRFDEDLGWISFGNTGTSRRIVEYIENLASAACMPRVLDHIAQGSWVQFGAWRLSRSSLRGPAGAFLWRDVIEVARDERDLLIRRREGGSVLIPWDEVPFPSLFTALARGIYGHTREAPP